MATTLETTSGSGEPRQGERASSPTERERIEILLADRPELEHSPTRIAELLHIPKGSAGRLLKERRDGRTPAIVDLLGPVLLQNVRIVGRTDPGTTPLGSPSLSALGPWSDPARGDRGTAGKLSASVPLPADGRAEISLAPTTGTLEILLAAPRGLTAAEVLLALALLRPPFRPADEVTVSFEVLRDGSSFRFEDVGTRTYRSVEAWLFKAYNHTDARGTVGRVEVRAPPIRVTFRELEAFLEGKQPLGRDAKIEALTRMVEDLSRGVVMMKRELRLLSKKIDGGSPIGSPLAKGGDGDAVR